MTFEREKPANWTRVLTQWPQLTVVSRFLCVAQADCELRDLPAPASQMLESQACAIMPGLETPP